jgi:long-chain acyl-CoA synthetase
MVTYADLPWQNNYDSHVPETLKPYPEFPLYELLRQSAQKFPDRPLTLTSAEVPLAGRLKKTLTYREIDQLSDALASGLVEMGLQKGDRVAIIMPNCAQFVISFYAILKAGGVVAATNPTYPPNKLSHQLKDSGAKIAIVLSLFYNNVKQVQDQTDVEKVIVTNIKEYLPGIARVLFSIAKEKKEGHAVELKAGDVWFQDVLAQNQGKKPDVVVKSDDLALFQYTGGTTGVSKAAVATHKALVANSLMCQAWMNTGDKPAEEHIFLGAIPMFHVYGMVAVLSFAVSIGSMITLVPNARDIDDVLGHIDTYHNTMFMGVPALFNAINNHEKVKSGEVDLSSIEVCFSGSAPLPPSTKAEFEKYSGGVVCEGFGMSEAPTATHGNPVKGQNKTGSIGMPFPDVECKLVSLDDGVTEVPIGEPGELCIHSPHIMMGYHNMPTETKNSLREDSSGKAWLYTGDIARMDEDGYFYIVDRKKDMALIGGFNVYPRNVEDVIAAHPAVLEVGVASIPHPEKVGQEALKAWIALKPDMTATDQEIINYAREKLARYEVPTRIEFVDELPKTTVGKILRRELVKQETAVKE